MRSTSLGALKCTIMKVTAMQTATCLAMFGKSPYKRLYIGLPSCRALPNHVRVNAQPWSQYAPCSDPKPFPVRMCSWTSLDFRCATTIWMWMITTYQRLYIGLPFLSAELCQIIPKSMYSPGTYALLWPQALLVLLDFNCSLKSSCKGPIFHLKSKFVRFKLISWEEATLFVS